jgi:hypothetical protein
MGQCNDAYGAVVVATALADAFGCGVNGRPTLLYRLCLFVLPGGSQLPPHT